MSLEHFLTEQSSFEAHTRKRRSDFIQKWFNKTRFGLSHPSLCSVLKFNLFVWVPIRSINQSMVEKCDIDGNIILPIEDWVSAGIPGKWGAVTFACRSSCSPSSSYRQSSTCQWTRKTWRGAACPPRMPWPRRPKDKEAKKVGMRCRTRRSCRRWRRPWPTGWRDFCFRDQCYKPFLPWLTITLWTSLIVLSSMTGGLHCLFYFWPFATI